MHRVIASFAAAGALLAASPALAGDQDMRTAKVSHADLDLSSAEGRATLDRRIAKATENVCGSYAGATVEEQDAIAGCRAKAGRQISTQLAGRRARNSVAAR